MADWKKIKSNVKNAANTTIKKTSEIAESATMQVKLTTLKSKRNTLYEKLGRLTYNQR